MTFDGANKYCEESIEKLQQLASYLKERRKIEEAYAHSLRTRPPWGTPSHRWWGW